LAEKNILIHGICLIEWGEKIEEFLPKEYIKISFEKDNSNDNVRVLNFEPIGEKYINLLNEVFKN